MQPDRHQFGVLDSWRGLCACLVALSHFHVYNHVFDVKTFWNAGYYVDFFFVLSGFVIFANYQTRLEQGFGVARFMLIRFGRIYPLHLATLLLFICHELLQLALPASAGFAHFKPFSSPGEGGWEILMNLFLLNSLNTVDVYSFNSPSWSISAELWTYLLFALLLSSLARWQRLWMPVLCISGFIWFEWFGGKFTTHDWGVFRCVYGFAAGGLCWQLWNNHRGRLPHPGDGSPWWTMLEALSVLLVILLVNEADAGIFVGLTPFVFAALVYVFAFEQGRLSKLLSHKFFLLLGALSYSVYMLHAFISWKVINPMIDIFHHVSTVPITTIIDGDQKLGLTRWQGDLATLIYLAGVIAASYLSYRFFEMPCRAYFKSKAEIWCRPKP